MLIGVAVLALLLALLVIAVDYATPAIRDWLRRRDVVRRSAVDQQLQAMRAAQQLSFMAWTARRAMQAVEEEMRSPRSTQTSRVTRTRYYK